MNKTSLRRWIHNPWSIGKSFARRGWLNHLPDKVYLAILYRANLNKKLNWDNPKTYNEKLQWLKLYDRNPIYCTMVDKYEAKQYVSDRIGSEYVVPCLGGPWTRFEEIDFSALPDQFVLKTTHDCGGVYICKDKNTFDHKKALTFLNKHLKRNYYLHCREWPYKNVHPRIFAEKYISDEINEVLPVYKILCFSGKPRIIQAITNDKQKDESIDYFDINWNYLDLRQNFPNSEIIPGRPKNLEKMLEIASILSEDHAFIRIDLYEANGNVYFSEYTFYSDAGFAKFDPEEWDEILGSWISLPERK